MAIAKAKPGKVKRVGGRRDRHRFIRTFADARARLAGTSAAALVNSA
eukprot:CAMPEP_0204532906 /NCGR_PEP_ID=MMETSP0661-20131031/11988_1 /ASSEMBLY_ACC=CAM_ASM_000606 /TAXON_ID=109239 /ORGANISM="Alexandrium margalefi, Strain AMGDE01CS-322" /LENGTH=46 /DNA_ID= /DNA_START= /DNA_END= /DNA_ORIENTATION=